MGNLVKKCINDIVVLNDAELVTLNRLHAEKTKYPTADNINAYQDFFIALSVKYGFCIDTHFFNLESGVLCRIKYEVS